MTLIRHFRSNETYAAWDEYQAFCKLFWGIEERKQILAKIKYKKIIDLSSGLNLYAPPDVLLKQLRKDSTNPLFYFPYEAPSGQPFVVRAILAYEMIRSDVSIDLDYDNVAVTPGTTYAFHCVGKFIAENYDKPEALIPVPTYSGFGLAMSKAGISVTDVGSKGGPGKIPSSKEILSCINEKTRLIYMCPVNNPTGNVVEEYDVRELLILAKYKGIFIVWDETSSSLSLPDVHIPNIRALAYSVGAEKNIIIISGTSKDRSNPGHRIGWLVGDKKLISMVIKQQIETYAVPASIFSGFIIKDLMFRLFHTTPSVEVKRKIYLRFMEILLGDNGPNWPSSKQLEIEFHEYLIPGLQQFLANFKSFELLAYEYEKIQEWNQHFIIRILENESRLKSTLGIFMEECTSLQSGYNIFVKLKLPPTFDHHSFVTSLYAEKGVEILPGEIFGLTSQDWHKDWGFWIRFTLSSRPQLFNSGLQRLQLFIRHKNIKNLNIR